MNFNYFVTTFSLNSNAGFILTSENEYPSLTLFPDYIYDNLSQFSFDYLLDNIYTFFQDMEEDYKINSINTIEQSGSDLPLLMNNYTDIMVDAEWQESEKVPSNGTLFVVTQNIGVEQIIHFLNLFSDLYDKAVIDPNVEQYSSTMLSKAVFRLNQDRSEMGDGTRMRKLISVIASGIGNNCLSRTKTSLERLKAYTTQLFPGPIPDLPNLKTNLQKARSEFMISSITEDRYNVLQGGNLRNQRLSRYVTSTNIQVSNLQRNTQNKSTGGYYGSMLSSFFVRIFRRSGLRKSIVQGTASLMGTVMSSNPNFKPYSTSASNLNISTSLQKYEVYVNFSGNFSDTSIGGSFSISANSMRYIMYRALYSSINLPNEASLRLVQKIGTEEINEQTLYTSFLCFLYSYLCIISYCLVDQNNIFGIYIDPAGKDNMNFCLTEYFMNEMVVEFSATVNNQPLEIRNILRYASPKEWIPLIYDWK